MVFATGGGAALQQQPPRLHAGHEAKQRSGNALDSSAPTVRRGKERETPKKKRPSALRKVSSGIITYSLNFSTLSNIEFLFQVITKEKTDRKQDLGKATIVEETGQSEARAEINDPEEEQASYEEPVVPVVTPRSDHQVVVTEQVSPLAPAPRSIHNRKFRE